MAKHESIGASDLMKKLDSDPVFQERMRKKELERQANRKVLDEDQKEIIQELGIAGVVVNSVWDLVNTNDEYPLAIPTLASHLLKEHHLKTTEGIVRALCVSFGKGAATPELIELFKMTDVTIHEELKWLIGSAISESATPVNVPNILELINDQAHGDGREFLPMALVCLPKEESKPLLEVMLKDSVLKKAAQKALKLLS